MANCKSNLTTQNLVEVLRCTACLSLPDDPLQCPKCDSITCTQCWDETKTFCFCKSHYTQVKPMTKMLFDGLEAHCKECGEVLTLLDYAKHQTFCGTRSIFSASYRFKLTEQDIRQELRCIVCLCIPTDPLQCVDCDSLVCRTCYNSTSSAILFSSKCEYHHCTQVKPKTRMLFDNLEIECEKCSVFFKSLEYAEHEKICGKKPDVIQIEAPSQPYRTYQPPKTSLYPRRNVLPSIQLPISWWISVIMVGLLSLAAMGTCYAFAIKYIFLNTDHKFKAFCVENLLSDKSSICLFAVGQFSVGIIAIGQVAIGLFTLGQVGIGIFVGVGQAMGGAGFAIAQVASASYVVAAQLGLGFVRVRSAQFGLHSLYPYFEKEERKKKAWVSCH